MSMGIYGVALLMAIENVVLPLPSELIMPLSGFAASRAGEQKIKAWVTKHGRWLLLRPTDLDKPKRRFAKHGAFSVIIGRSSPAFAD